MTRLDGRSRWQPVEQRRQPGGEHDRARVDVSGRRGDLGHPAALGRDGRGRGPGRHRGQHRGQAGQRPQRVHPRLLPDQRPGHGAGQTRNQLGDLVVVEPFHRRALVRGEPVGIRCQPDPVQLDQPDAARPALLQLAPQLQAGPGQVDEGLGVAPLVDLRRKQPGRPAGGARAQPPRLDEQDRAEPGRMTGGRGGDADYSPADHQDVGARQRDAARAPAELCPLFIGEPVPPDWSLSDHDPIVSLLGHHLAPQSVMLLYASSLESLQAHPNPRLRKEVMPGAG